MSYRPLANHIASTQNWLRPRAATCAKAAEPRAVHPSSAQPMRAARGGRKPRRAPEEAGELPSALLRVITRPRGARRPQKACGISAARRDLRKPRADRGALLEEGASHSTAMAFLASFLRTLTLAFAALHFLDPAPLGRGPARAARRRPAVRHAVQGARGARGALASCEGQLL